MAAICRQNASGKSVTTLISVSKTEPALNKKAVRDLLKTLNICSLGTNTHVFWWKIFSQ
jgi:hypothetical protein